jgi:RNA polymerase-binding transcription factor DksA
MRVWTRFEWQQQSRLIEDRDRLTRLLSDLRKAATSRHDYEPHDIIDDEAAIQADAIEARIAATDRALARIEAGTYGDCVECASRIGNERIQALPATIVCLHCAS